MTSPAPDDPRRSVDALAGRTVVVVGDLMLDRFLMGRVTRISPEAPVPVVEFRREEVRLGGAANVAHTIRALDGQVRLVGVVGADEAGGRLRAELARLTMSDQGVLVDEGRTTTTKLRIVTDRNQQVARVDYEFDADVAPSLAEALADRIDEALDGAHCVVVSDYLKGTVTADVMTRMMAAATARRVPVLVDPKIPHLELYRGATVITPNHVEAELATHGRIRTTDDARSAARIFRERAGCQSVLLTRGEHGMWLLDASAEGTGGAIAEMHLPAIGREVSDVTGAGDTVIGTMALALAAGMGLGEAARLANYAAGVAVGKFGPVPVTRDELIAAIAAGGLSA